MGTPRFEPRSLLVEAAAFGRDPYAKFVSADRRGIQYWQLQTAKVQHLIAFRMRALARQRGQTLAQFAAETSTMKIRTLRLLRGEAAMQIEDVFWAEEVLGERQMQVQFASKDW